MLFDQSLMISILESSLFFFSLALTIVFLGFFSLYKHAFQSFMLLNVYIDQSREYIGSKFVILHKYTNPFFSSCFDLDYIKRGYALTKSFDISIVCVWVNVLIQCVQRFVYYLIVISECERSIGYT